MIRFAVHVGKRRCDGELAIVGYRYPPSKDEPGKKENIVRDGEVRVASGLLAVLAVPSLEKPRWTSDRRESAQHIASAIPGARVVATSLPDQKKGKRSDR